MKIIIMDTNRHGKMESGYGNMARAFAEGLHRLKHDVYFDSPIASGVPIIDLIAKKTFTHTPDTIYLWTKPPSYIKNNNFNPEYKNVFFTMHESMTFEGDKKEWPELLNKCKMVITPTNWNQAVFVNCGVKVPVKVIPLGTDIRTFHPSVGYDSFNMLTVHEAFGSDTSRENWLMTLEAFNKQFQDRDNVTLTVKTWNARQDRIDELEKKGLMRNVNVRQLSLDPPTMASLYQQHFVFIKNSDREGWSIPLTEAMACGMPVIVFKNQVLSENVRNYPQASWFNKVEQLQYHMDYWYKIWRTSREYLMNFSWQNTIDRLEDELETL